MLAVVQCLKEQDAELRSVQQFQVKTDYKNLEYFTTVRKLTERQMRWLLILSKYNFVLLYVLGKTNVRADALSRREQDMPSQATDDRLQYRHIQLLPKSKFQLIRVGVDFACLASEIKNSTAAAPTRATVPNDNELQQLQSEAELQDASYQEIVTAVYTKQKKFSLRLGVKVLISEYSLSLEGKLEFRGRQQVPDNKQLRTKLIQETHNSMIRGHIGREVTSALMMRQFFQLNMLTDIQRFVRNCDNC